jgi:hypothetical protein
LDSKRGGAGQRRYIHKSVQPFFGPNCYSRERVGCYHQQR